MCYTTIMRGGEYEKERTDSLEYIAKNEKLKAISKELDRAYEQSETAYRYNLEVERYCQEQGITIGQYEKQCFWADRDWGNYPEPERHNPDRCIEPERDTPNHSIIEHEW